MYPLIAWNALLGAVSYRVAVDEPDGDHAEYDDFRSAAASFGKMTGTGVLGVSERTSRRRRSGHRARGREPSTSRGRWASRPAPGRMHRRPPCSSAGILPGTKQYRVLVANREDFATTVEDVRTDNASLAPTLTSTLYLSGGTFWWKVAAYDEDNNVGDFTRAHSFTLQKTTGAGGIRVSQRLRIFVKGRLRAHRMSRVVVTIKAGGKVVPAAKVRGLGLGMRARWRATNRRGQVVFRFRPKGKGMVFFQATKRNYRRNAGAPRRSASPRRRRRRRSLKTMRRGRRRARLRAATRARGRPRRRARTRGRVTQRPRRRRSRGASQHRRPHG